MEKSCGILVYRYKKNVLQLLLAHTGMFGARNGWNIPKGHIQEGETEQECALREFHEETSLVLPDKELIDVGTGKTSKGKIVRIFALEHDFSPKGDDVSIRSNLCRVEYPCHSGRFVKVPELSDAKYVAVDAALDDMYEYQKVFITNLVSYLDNRK